MSKALEFSNRETISKSRLNNKLQPINLSVDEKVAKKDENGNVSFINDKKTKIPVKCNTNDHNDKDHTNLTNKGKQTLKKLVDAVETKKVLCDICRTENGLVPRKSSNQELWTVDAVKEWIESNHMEGYIVYPLTASLKKQLNVPSVGGKKLDLDVFIKFPKYIAEKCGKSGIGIMIDGSTHWGAFTNIVFTNDHARDSDNSVYVSRINVLGFADPNKNDEENKRLKELDIKHIKDCVGKIFVHLKDYIDNVLDKPENPNNYRRRISKLPKEQVSTFKGAKHAFNKFQKRSSEEMLKRLIQSLMRNPEDKYQVVNNKGRIVNKSLSGFLSDNNLGYNDDKKIRSLGHKSYMKYSNIWDKIAGDNVSPDAIREFKKKYQAKPGEKLFDPDNLKLFEEIKTR